MAERKKSKKRHAENSVFVSVPTALKILKSGKPLIVVDDKKRENEGDLVLAGEKVNEKQINFMIKHGRGLVCAPISKEIAERFDLHLMSRLNDRHQTAFTVSIDSKKSSTGISAKERAETIKALLNNEGKPSDFSKPGHIFPLIARSGGVLRRAGHTEASIDLMKLSKLKEVAVICEIIKENGEMARLSHLEKFAKKHKLKILSVADIISYRLKSDSLVEKETEVSLPTKYGNFRAIAFTDIFNKGEYIALVKGYPEGKQNVLVRVHSGCLTGDTFGSFRCDCGEQLIASLKIIEKEKEGVLLYIHQHEGRGIGLMDKLKAYSLQERGLDTIEANNALGFPADLRDYGMGAQVLRALKLTTIKLLTNNPKKIIGLDKYGLKITKRISLSISSSKHNEKYLKTKKTKLGHLL